MQKKSNQNWIIDLNSTLEPIQYREEKISTNLHAVKREKSCENKTLLIKQVEQSKWDYIKLRSVCTSKLMTRIQIKTTEWKKPFVYHSSDKKLIPQMNKALVEIYKKNFQPHQ